MTDFSPPPSEIEPEPEQTAPPDRRLFRGGLALLAATLGYYAFNADTGSTTELYAGLTIIVLATLPALMWARRATYEFPVFEVFMLTGVNIYALPLLNRQNELQNYSETVIMQAAQAVLLFQIVAIAAYAVTRGRAGTTPFWSKEIVSHDIGKYLGYGLVLTTVYTAVANFTDWIPIEMEGVVRAVFFGIGIIATFIQGRRWGQNDLTPG